MNLPYSTPSIIRRRNDFGVVETSKFLNTFPRSATDTLSPGFSMNYWGTKGYSPDNTWRRGRSCVGEGKPSAEDLRWHEARMRSASKDRARTKSTMSGRTGPLAASRSPSPTPRDHAVMCRHSSAGGETAPPAGSPKRQGPQSPRPISAQSRRLRRSTGTRSRQRAPEEFAHPNVRRALNDASLLLDLQDKVAELEAQLLLERKERKAAEDEARAEAETRQMLEAHLTEAAVSFQAAKDRLHALVDNNDALRKEQEKAAADYAALERQVRA